MKAEIFTFDNDDIPAPGWLVKDLIPLGHLCFLLAQSGSGKSFLLESLALHIVFGQSFCDLETHYGNVLIIDQDTPSDVLSTRLKRMRRGFSNGLQPIHEIRIASMQGLSLETDQIPHLINAYNPTLTIIDSMHSVCGRLKSNNTTDMGILAYIKSQCLAPDRTIIFSHHLTEKISFTLEQLMDSDQHLSGMGNSVIKQQADTEFILASTLENNKIDRIFLRPVAKRQAIPQTPVIIRMQETDSSFSFTFDGYYTPQTNEIESDIMLLFFETREEFTVKEIRDRMGMKWGDKVIREALSALEAKKKLIMRRNRSNLFKYKIPLF